MAKKKNKAKAQSGQGSGKPDQKSSVTQPSVQPTKPATLDDAIASKSEAEFENIKKRLIEQLTEEIEFWNKEKQEAEDAAKRAAEKQKEEEKNLDNIRNKKQDLDKEITDLKNEIKEIKETANTVKNEADSYSAKVRKEAEDIKESAEKDRIDLLTKATEEAKAIWKDKADELTQQLKELSDREQKLWNDKKALDHDKLKFEDEKEALDELKEILKARKNRYDEANPAKISVLENQLEDERKRTAVFSESRDKLSERVAFLESLLNNVKTEIEGAEQSIRIASVKEIVTALQELRDKHEKLVSIYTRYPDDAAIAKLEENAKKAERLEQVNETLIFERNRYQEELFAARNAKRALDVIKQEVEATNALNEHLLQELESHKTALESRTGDTCPSLSKVDTETESVDFKNDVSGRIRRRKLTSLQEIVSHVKNYAGSRPVEEQLYYTDNDIRAFLAGMSVSRLIILQGMSGTGKSSLPRIFSEAISGFNKLIPVESSWRDRNELLGYYNDFNKKFNAKSFTIELYRSSKDRCAQIPTFIVLDEMNLARIEYYFSDFLAILQEPDHNKWLIELVASDMRTLPMELPDDIKKKMATDDPSIYSIWEKMEKARQGDLKSNASDDEKELLTAYLDKLGQLTGAKSLIDGRKVRVTDNIWFVGTANRDESTFEISDKVYDRAQVVSLNRKGVPEKSYAPSTAKFISVTDLEELFHEAVLRNRTQKEVEDKLSMLDSVLMDKFDLSFGNRIVTQTINFTAVFVAAGGSLEDALDYQISTKILRKVISSDDAEALLVLLDSVKDYKETTRLLEKRLKELK
jgi:hypothetical protein